MDRKYAQRVRRRSPKIRSRLIARATNCIGFVNPIIKCKMLKIARLMIAIHKTFGMRDLAFTIISFDLN
jgi:hypothetical protein